MRIELTKRQTQAFDLLVDKATRYILYGGAKGGGKSFLLCLWAYTYALQLCKLFGLKPSNNPLPVGFIGRKRGNDFRKTTLETWRRFIPAGTYEIKNQAGEIVLFNSACKIFFGGLDNTETVNKFNSAELAFFGVDQAEEVTREEISVLRGALRLTHGGITPQYKELYTANPSDCWLKEDFIDRQQDGYKYIPALPSDNPHLPNDYIKTIEEAFKYSQPLLRAYRDGDWNALKSSNTLISSDDLEKLRKIALIGRKEKRVVVCDPATSYDECVIYYMRNYKVEDLAIVIGEQDTMKIAGVMATMARKHSVLDVGGDSIGLGKGIFDRLDELGDFRIHPINSARSSSRINFKNIRAEIYWNLMQAVIDKRIPFPEEEELRRQLINITYEVRGSNGEIIITDKTKIKSIIGHSPDRADCFAYGVYLSDQVEPWVDINKNRRYVFDDAGAEFSPALV